MNTLTILVSIASFFGGAIAGGYLVNRKLTNEFAEWRKKLQSENENLRKEREKARKKLTETIEKYSEKADVTIKSQFSHNLTDIKPELDELSKKYKDEDFDEHFGDREYPEDDDEVDDPDADFYDGGSREPYVLYRPPFEIDPDELESEFSDCELTSITFYQGDGMLLDERGELISDVAGLLGPMVADALPTCTDDYIYVHNDIHDTNYEVIIDQGSSGYLDSFVRGLDY